MSRLNVVGDNQVGERLADCFLRRIAEDALGFLVVAGMDGTLTALRLRPRFVWSRVERLGGL